MSSSSDDQSVFGNSNASASSQKKYKGIRRRKWGKWVSEIRVPGTPERLWLGSYSTPEAAAVAHDVAFYCLRGDSSPQNLNFPLALPAGARAGLSPRSAQRAASDAGLATDARLLHSSKSEEKTDNSAVGGQNIWQWQQNDSWRGSSGGSNEWFGQPQQQEQYLSISVEDYL